MGTGSFLRVRWPGRGVDHPPPSTAEVKGRVKLYIYSPSGPSWPVLGWTLPLVLVAAAAAVVIVVVVVVVVVIIWIFQSWLSRHNVTVL
jgi:cobalamin synthase